MQKRRRGGGRQPRGERKVLVMSVAEDFYVRLVLAARSQGLALSEYICAETAKYHRFEVPDYIKPAVEPIPSLGLAAEQAPVPRRKTATTRFPVDQFDWYQNAAAARDVSLADYVRTVLTEVLEPGSTQLSEPHIKEASLLSA